MADYFTAFRLFQANDELGLSAKQQSQLQQVRLSCNTDSPVRKNKKQNWVLFDYIPNVTR